MATLTISTSRSAGQEPDLGTPALAGFVDHIGADLAGAETIPDDRGLIQARLVHWCDSGQADLVLTSGGTGLAPTDVTPEATLAVIDREVPGIAEAMRLASRPHTPYWMLSRGVAGIRGAVLIVNFPGNPRAIAEAGEPLRDVLQHAVALLGDAPSGH